LHPGYGHSSPTNGGQQKRLRKEVQGYLRLASGLSLPVVVQPGAAVRVYGINTPVEVVGTYFPGLIPTGFIRHIGGSYESFNVVGHLLLRGLSTIREW
jgi:hypothetical protein